MIFTEFMPSSCSFYWVEAKFEAQSKFFQDHGFLFFDFGKKDQFEGIQVCCPGSNLDYCSRGTNDRAVAALPHNLTLLT